MAPPEVFRHHWQALRSPVGGPLDLVVFIFNFFEELRRIAPAAGSSG